MDTKTVEQILKLLLECKNENNYIKHPLPLIIQKLPDMTEEHLRHIFKILESKNLISATIADNTIRDVIIRPKGLGYFSEKPELQTKKPETRRWGLFQNIIIAIAGTAIGIAGTLAIQALIKTIWG